VIDQIGVDACRPKKLAGTSLEDDGDELHNNAIKRVARNKQGAKRRLTEEGISDELESRSTELPTRLQHGHKLQHRKQVLLMLCLLLFEP
jgi:hypothetical protein